MRTPDDPECQRQFNLMLLKQDELEVTGIPGTSALAAPLRPDDAWRLAASIRFGHDNNYYRRTQLQSLTLTLPQGRITLPLAENQAPRARNFWTVILDASTLHTSVELKADTLPGKAPDNIQSRLNHARETPHGLFGVNLATLDLSSYAHARKASTYWLTPLTPRSYAILNLTWNHYAASPGQSLAIDAGVALRLTPELIISGRMGYDITLEERPGGNQLTGLLSLNYDTHHLRLGLGCQLTQDMDGYSPLLNNNNPRHQSHCYSNVKIQWPLSRKTKLQCGLETWKQWSDINLFQHHGHALWIGIQHEM